MNMNPLELLKFIEGSVEGDANQLNALALMADAPADDFTSSMKLPVQNQIPAFQLGDKGLGSMLANLNYGSAAPVPGQAPEPASQSIGDMLTGEING